MTTTKITTEILKEWNACADGFRRFCELFPEGADLKTAAEGLDADGHYDWAIWLFGHCREDARFKEQAKEGFNNTGHWNTGHWNTGDRNTGDRNTGDRNTGHWNTGHWNTGDRNTGHFNTITPEDVLLFNKPCKHEVWEKAKKPNFIYGVCLTYWVSESQMTDAEELAAPYFYMRGGQLRRRTYHEAWKLAWDSASPADRELIKQLPNYDAQVFFDISGIDLRGEK